MDQRERDLEALYRERYVAFRNTAATVTGSYESAHDAVQEAFARALRARGQYRSEGSLEAWVWTILLRCAQEEFRRTTGHTDLDVAGPQLVEPERDPFLAEALRALSPRRRLLIFLRYFADLSYAEIGAVCQIKVGTVAATLAQARETLAQELEQGVQR